MHYGLFTIRRMASTGTGETSLQQTKNGILMSLTPTPVPIIGRELHAHVPPRVI